MLNITSTDEDFNNVRCNRMVAKPLSHFTAPADTITNNETRCTQPPTT